MLIRTQDKRILFDISGMQFYANGAGKIIGSNTSDPSDGYVLCGTYSTKEKEIKVLDMIEKCYVGTLYTDSHYNSRDMCSVADVIANNVVFQMPQESEVEE